MKKYLQTFKQQDKTQHRFIAIFIFPWIFFAYFIECYSPNEAVLFKDLLFALASVGVITLIGFAKELYDSKFLKNKKKFDKWDILVMTIDTSLLSLIIIVIRQFTFN